MSRIDCINNRNIRIIASYVKSRIGRYGPLFDGLPYPENRYPSPNDFFLNEDEWTTLENFHKIFRTARDLVGEKSFYFNCGASSARLRSWGRLNYFIRVFAGPSDGFKRLPFFNKTLNDTKEIEIIAPPAYDKASGRIRTILKVEYHKDIDVHRDYIVDPYRRGLISSIPTIWGLRPAKIKQTLYPYDPEILLREEPELTSFGLDAKMEMGNLTIREPKNGHRKIVGKKILLEPEPSNGKNVFLGRYHEFPQVDLSNRSEKGSAIVITETVKVDNRIIFREGEIFGAPYFILDVTYDRFSLLNRLSQIFKTRDTSKDSEDGMIETINELRESIRDRNEAYHAIEKVNAELEKAKKELEDYTKNLKKMVDERTYELKKAKEEVMGFNRTLQSQVDTKARELKKYHELTRYLSPKLAEKILSSGDTLGAKTQRKMMTVMFVDIRNFSSVTDSIEPEELFHLLDKYLTEMTTLIHEYDGTLNKIMGDGLLIFFGDPISIEDHAQRAVMMAVDMQKKAMELRDEWLQYGHELGIGIGINTGYMTVGNIGSDAHMDYTVIGNQVNVAARLESIAKAGQILISQRTYTRVKDLGLAEFDDIGGIQVKGINTPVVTYNVKVF